MVNHHGQNTINRGLPWLTMKSHQWSIWEHGSIWNSTLYLYLMILPCNEYWTWQMHHNILTYRGLCHIYSKTNYLNFTTIFVILRYESSMTSKQFLYKRRYKYGSQERTRVMHVEHFCLEKIRTKERKRVLVYKILWFCRGYSVP